MSRIGLLVAVLIASSGQRSAGQNIPVLAPGSRVRVSTASSYAPVVGTVIAQEADSLRLLVAGRGAPVAVAFASIRDLEINRGRHSNAGRGALIGLGVGAGAGLLLGVAASSCGAEDWICPGPAAVPAMALLVGSLGTGIGALIGLTSSSERWERVSWDRPLTVP